MTTAVPCTLAVARYVFVFSRGVSRTEKLATVCGSGTGILQNTEFTFYAAPGDDNVLEILCSSLFGLAFLLDRIFLLFWNALCV